MKARFHKKLLERAADVECERNEPDLGFRVSPREHSSKHAI